MREIFSRLTQPTYTLLVVITKKRILHIKYIKDKSNHGDKKRFKKR